MSFSLTDFSKNKPPKLRGFVAIQIWNSSANTKVKTKVDRLNYSAASITGKLTDTRLSTTELSAGTVRMMLCS